MYGKVLAAVLALLAYAGGSPATDSMSEGHIKALYILNFARFTTWPDEQGTNEFRIGYIKNDASREHLEELEEETLRGRPIRVRRVITPADATSCDVVFLNTADLHVMEDFLEELRGRPVLTVTDTKGFASQGAMVGLFFVGDKLRFEINITRVREARLSMSSHLLGLARIIDENGKPVGPTGSPTHEEVAP